MSKSSRLLARKGVSVRNCNIFVILLVSFALHSCGGSGGGSSGAAASSTNVSSPASVVPAASVAALGAPSSTKFNGLGLIADTLHKVPKHAVSASVVTLPAALTGLPSMPDITVLNRRDALIVYVPAVKGAADYRAYVYDSSKVTFSGSQPRGAVIACSGFRQRYGFRNVDALLSNRRDIYTTIKNRELLQAIEVPGLVNNGNYTVIVEALASPCPFPGVMAHTNAVIPIIKTNVDTKSFIYRSFTDVKTLYGNEIINGQGSLISDYKVVYDRQGLSYTPAGPLGQPVPPNNTVMPSDPTVIARSAITVSRPAADESVNAPIFDVGANSVFDDFSTDGVMTSFAKEVRDEGSGLFSGGAFGDWFFWTGYIQPAFKADGISYENGNNPKGVQVWRRHGRLYSTIADAGQDVFGSVYFSSTKTRPQQLDTTGYVHSFFRVDSGATNRRYWHWMMCGADTPAELVNTTTGIPLARPVGTSFFYAPRSNNQGGTNPSSPMQGETQAAHHNKECLSLIQLGTQWNDGFPADAAASKYDEPHSALHAFIHPAGAATGVINLKPSGMQDGDTSAEGGMLWRVNAAKKATGPMFEPFDQQAPLTHFDVFVRTDRVIFYVNGRQAWCADLSDRNLQMKYGLIAYGNVLYHSAAETREAYLSTFGGSGPTFGAVGGSTHYIMNTPWADTRVWDAVGHSEKIGIPSQLSFDASACFKPQSSLVR